MVLDLVHQRLGWPAQDQIFAPEGMGAKVLVELAQEKLGKAISALVGGKGVHVGILASDPDATSAPFAIVCNFSAPVPAQTLFEAQRLAWNFSRSMLLITIEPHIIRKWSCYEGPVDFERFDLDPESILQADHLPPNVKSPEILPPIHVDEKNNELNELAANSLHWVDLVSGYFFQQHANRFTEEARADRTLLSSLKEVRRRLRWMGLSDIYSHDLIARIIFVQFLFDRKDSTNIAALNKEKLLELNQIGVLSSLYSSFSEILNDYDDTYALFQWLNQKFNGDLFPGRGVTEKQQEDAWYAEKAVVTSEHLRLLADFVRGDMEIQTGQLSLWPLYSFDAIPLEFISSIYEEFVRKDEGVGIHYTPDYLVDLMLDRVLPWDNEEWDVKVLDPACGSGIFLVKAYQRLIHRWKYAHRKENIEIHPNVLRGLLENNLFGVDKDENAVRVASFSLYLAMCDEIDPRHYWSDESIVYFPPLRGKGIIHSDFFDESKEVISTFLKARTYDIVLGNPPWGDTTITPAAIDWAKAYGWDAANKDFGVLFAVKSSLLVKPGGQVCMVQSANSLLYNRESTADKFRYKLLNNFKKVENIINLSAFQLFRDANVATCILILENIDSDGSFFWYECPKPFRFFQANRRIIIEPQDVHAVYPQEIANEPWIWSTLMWGGARDRNLIRKLSSHYYSIEKLKKKGVVKTRQGIIKGDRKKEQPVLLGRKFLDGTNFPKNTRFPTNLPSLFLQMETLDTLTDIRTDSRASTDIKAFDLPQLLIKISWVVKQSRFQARIVKSDTEAKGVVCSRGFISVHADPGWTPFLEASCICYNSSFANYYMFLTSGRFSFRFPTESLVGDIRNLPIPTPRDGMLNNLTTFEDIDRRVYELFALQETDIILIEDLVNYVLMDYKRPNEKHGSQRTHRYYQNKLEPELQAYCDVFVKVFRAAYGNDKYIGATIFTDHSNEDLPIRMVSIYLNLPNITSVQVLEETPSKIKDRLKAVYKLLQRGSDTEMYYHQCIRAYDSVHYSDHVGIMVNIIKPDQIRFWTRSAALRDADDIISDLILWTTASQHGVYDG